MSCWVVVRVCVFVSVSNTAPKRDVYTVDMRNHGQSPHVSEMDLHSLSRDVTKLMDTEGEYPLAACLVRQRPERFHRQ